MLGSRAARPKFQGSLQGLGQGWLFWPQTIFRRYFGIPGNNFKTPTTLFPTAVATCSWAEIAGRSFMVLMLPEPPAVSRPSEGTEVIHE